MRLQSILLPKAHICEEKTVYFHENESKQDFDSYFNLFYIEKHKKYTTMSSLQLVIELQGYNSITLMHDREEIETKLLCEKERKTYIFKFPYETYDKGVFWFRLEKAQNVHDMYIRGYYEGITDSKRKINIAVDICTYKREAYVLRNMKQIVSFFEQEEQMEVSKHLKFFLIDNGQTLQEHKEIQELIQGQSGKIQIIPNQNTGGSGGFTRGMQEAIYQKEKCEFTHVLLMDDDAVFDTDVFVRIYGMLSILKDEYKDITIGGALWREDYPFIQYAFGEEYKSFKVINKHPMLDMRSYEECTQEDICTTEYEHEQYSGWWLCCYSLNVVREDNLPLPVFIHFDDIEYGLRNRKNGIVFLNGIGVWHRGFELDFHGWKEYYNVRNSLITMSIHEPEMSVWKIKLWFWRHLFGRLISYQYIDMQQGYMALIDFLKGEKWLRELDVEENHKKLHEFIKTKMQWSQLIELQLENREAIFAEIAVYGKKVSLEQLYDYYKTKLDRASIWKKITLNGWLLFSKKGEKLITPLDTPWKAYRYRRVVLYEPLNEKARAVRRQWGMFLKMIVWDIKIGIMLDSKYRKVARGFREKYSLEERK